MIYLYSLWGDIEDSILINLMVIFNSKVLIYSKCKGSDRKHELSILTIPVYVASDLMSPYGHGQVIEVSSPHWSLLSLSLSSQMLMIPFYIYHTLVDPHRGDP